MVFNITKFSENLLNDLDELDDDRKSKIDAKIDRKVHWMEINFEVTNTKQEIKVLLQDLIQFLELVS